MNDLIEQVKATGVGQYLPDIFSTLDGSDVKTWLESQGYVVVSNRDTGRNGIAVTACGIEVSTNGFVSRSAPHIREGDLMVTQNVPEAGTPTMDDLLCIRRHGQVPRFDPDTGQIIPESRREALTKAAIEQGLAQEVAGRLVLTRKGSSALFCRA